MVHRTCTLDALLESVRCLGGGVLRQEIWRLDRVEVEGISPIDQRITVFFFIIIILLVLSLICMLG